MIILLFLFIIITVKFIVIQAILINVRLKILDLTQKTIIFRSLKEFIELINCIILVLIYHQNNY